MKKSALSCCRWKLASRGWGSPFQPKNILSSFLFIFSVILPNTFDNRIWSRARHMVKTSYFLLLYTFYILFIDYKKCGIYFFRPRFTFTPDVHLANRYSTGSFAFVRNCLTRPVPSLPGIIRRQTATKKRIKKEVGLYSCVS
jgi:hypothetical protein